MTIAEFIRESVLRPRLKQAGALVVYDADKRYREQCFDLATDKMRVPGARTGLTLSLQNDSLVPKLAGAPVSNVAQRMGVLSKKYGDRFEEMPLNDFVRGNPKIADTVDLLVLRSTEIDSQLENNPETTLGLIPGTLKLIHGWAAYR